MGPSHKAAARFGSRSPRSWVPQKNGAEKGDIFMSYSVTIVGFVGADPEQRQVRTNGSKFTVLSVATQRSWKNAEDEWVSKVSESPEVHSFDPPITDLQACDTPVLPSNKSHHAKANPDLIFGVPFDAWVIVLWKKVCGL